ncbi:hypothetical protein ACWT_7513 [Actinoplanes sp. SE50]|uniref:SIMPL domain-containing protein n=1 Tax=unclassified Actinoplanes TaxID=2626549 RepID=UPI00023EDCD2|nr:MULTISPECIES: SIMPL domain-containing protein [unclassified Actinoplanes]AEV88523.1 hypothetical protein ACPL_7643 [Actinoplanes sp. SE50/110]ATO86928.1 hypothetical protein ACWT_7513 [Actinoplanes sp. SE50]SLM04346.1 hypothetical protein ACSP50_7651 [Actinoplanes sp. SE50/110]
MAERLPTVVATGEAVREVPPELATVHVHTVARGRDREAVLQRLTERSAAVAVVLDRFAAAIERRETAGVQVHPQTRRRGEGIAEYHGSIGTQVLITDFTVLGDLLLRLAGEELTSVSGPYWQLRPGSRAGAEARRAAVTDALARAAEYAAAVGSRIDRLIDISDVPTAEGTPMMVAGARAMSETAGLELEPALQTVHARVRVTVTISEPALPI